jgi:hypothetical protein
VTASKPPIESAGKVRVALASGATAAGLAAVLAGAAFGLQAVALPRPSRGQLIAAKTLRWLNRQDAVESVTFVRGHMVSSVCVNALVGPLRKSSHPLNASLLITGHRRLVETRFTSFRLGSTLREEDGPLPTIRAVLAGCPRALGRRLGRFLDVRVPIDVKSVVTHGRRLLELTFKRGDSRLFLIAEPNTFAPVAVKIARKKTGWSYLAPAEARDLAPTAERLSPRLRVLVKEKA